MKRNLIIISSLSAYLILWPSFTFGATEDRKFNASLIYLFNVVSEASTSAVDFDEGNGFAGFVGYNFLPYLALEVGGVSFDTIQGREELDTLLVNTEYQVSGYAAGIKGSFNFNDLFDVWASVGQYTWDSTFNYDISYATFPAIQTSGGDENSGSDMYARLGLRGSISERFSFTVEVSRFDLSNFFSDSSGGSTDFEQQFIGVGLEAAFW